MTVRSFPQPSRTQLPGAERPSAALSNAFADAIQKHIDTLRGDARVRADRVFRSAKERLAPALARADQPEFIDLRNVVSLRPRPRP